MVLLPRRHRNTWMVQPRPRKVRRRAAARAVRTAEFSLLVPVKSQPELAESAGKAAEQRAQEIWERAARRARGMVPARRPLVVLPRLTEAAQVPAEVAARAEE